MARNTQLRSQTRYSGSRQYVQDSEGSVDSRSSESRLKSTYTDNNGNLRLSMKQIIFFWSGTAIIMLLAFYLGFVAGKKQGVISVLDQAGEQMVRLELHTPLEPYPRATEIDPNVLTNSGNANPQKTVNENQNTKDSKIDFTAKTSLPNKIENKVVEKPNEIEKILLGNTNKKEIKEVEEEEIYPGKDLFGPPRQKTKEKEQNLVDLEQKELAQLEKKVEEPTLKQLVPSKGWYVQVSAAPSEKEALDAFKRISSKGLKVKLEPAAIKDRSFFRVLIGPFPSQAAAVEKRSELKQQAGVSGEPFIRQVQ